MVNPFVKDAYIPGKLSTVEKITMPFGKLAQYFLEET